jgi:hypothetical protein
MKLAIIVVEGRPRKIRTDLILCILQGEQGFEVSREELCKILDYLRNPRVHFVVQGKEGCASDQNTAPGVHYMEGTGGLEKIEYNGIARSEVF